MQHNKGLKNHYRNDQSSTETISLSHCYSETCAPQVEPSTVTQHSMRSTTSRELVCNKTIQCNCSHYPHFIDMWQKLSTRLFIYLYEYKNKCLDGNNKGLSVSPSSWSIENINFNTFTVGGFWHSYNSLVTLKQTKLLRCKCQRIEGFFKALT